MINLAETLEKSETENTPDEIMQGISEQKDSLQVILKATTLEEDVLKRLEGEMNIIDKYIFHCIF